MYQNTIDCGSKARSDDPKTQTLDPFEVEGSKRSLSSLAQPRTRLPRAPPLQLDGDRSCKPDGLIGR